MCQSIKNSNTNHIIDQDLSNQMFLSWTASAMMQYVKSWLLHWSSNKPESLLSFLQNGLCGGQTASEREILLEKKRVKRRLLSQDQNSNPDLPPPEGLNFTLTRRTSLSATGRAAIYTTLSRYLRMLGICSGTIQSVVKKRYYTYDSFEIC